jgi:hypothetical protein
VAELPNTSSTPAIINAVRDATNLELGRAPLRPDDIALAPLAATVVGGEFLLSKEETKT